MLDMSTAAEQKPAGSVSDSSEVLFCEQLRVLRPRTGAQVQFCAPRAESTDRREESLAELLADCCEARLPAMGPLLPALLGLVWPVKCLLCFLGLAWSVWVLV